MPSSDLGERRDESHTAPSCFLSYGFYDFRVGRRKIDPQNSVRRGSSGRLPFVSYNLQYESSGLGLGLRLGRLPGYYTVQVDGCTCDTNDMKDLLPCVTALY